MHHITDLKRVSKDIAQGLKTLKERIEGANIPPSQLDQTFNLATWNIREFGRVARTQAAIHYIAEVLGQFDLIGVVELRVRAPPTRWRWACMNWRPMRSGSAPCRWRPVTWR